MSLIRLETPADYRRVEEITREAFWNVNFPGCDEHYLVHVMRSHPDFLPELAYVLEENGEIIGNVMYSRSLLREASGAEKSVLTFGPLSILPAFQRKGFGKALLNYTFEKAREMGYEAIVIFGHPGNYVSRGFKSCRKYGVHLPGGAYPTAMLVLELKEGALSGGDWSFYESPMFENISAEDAEAFDSSFPPLEKAYRLSQEEFYIYSHSRLQA